MYNPKKHKSILIEILKKIYSDGFLASNLGFKGGTAMQLFYGLPRYSVDLDFDLLYPEKENEVFEKTGKILGKVGVLEEKLIKKWNIFFLLDYGRDERKVKVEINRRAFIRNFELKSFLGIGMLVMSKESMLANKMLAVVDRKVPASRDLFDLYFMLNENWKIDDTIIRERKNTDIRKFIQSLIRFVDKYPNEKLLQGIGEFIDAKQKAWVRMKLKDELIFLLRLYLKTGE